MRRFTLIFVSFIAFLVVVVVLTANAAHDLKLDDLAVTMSEGLVQKGNTSVFTDWLTSKPQFVLALFTDDECVAEENCDAMARNFAKAAKLWEARRIDRCGSVDDDSCTSVPKVQFIHIHDSFANIIEKYNVDKIPRVMFFEKGKGVHVGFFGTTKQNEDALVRFVSRMVQPQINRFSSAKELQEFLRPVNDDLRDVTVEDPVTFVLVEPESGSFRTRSAFEDVVKLHRAKVFFAHVKWAEDDWNKALNVTKHIVPPALIRVETGFGSRIILNGLDEFFKEDALQNAIGKYQFATVPEIGPHNFQAIFDNNQGLISVIKMFDSVEERDKARLDLIEISERFPTYLYVTMNRTKFMAFLLPMVDADTDMFAYYRRSGSFWMKDRKHNTREFVEQMLLGRIDPQYETGFFALPRLLKKAILKRPMIGVGLAFIVLALLAVFQYCACGFYNLFYGDYRPHPNEEVHEKTE